MTSTEDGNLSYPPPPVRWDIPDIPIRTLLPIYPPPEDILTHPPSLPLPQRQPNIHPFFRLSTHLTPAAYLRTTRYVSPPPESIMPNHKLAKEEKMKRSKEANKWLVDARGSDVEEKIGYERVLWICLNRYYRVEGSSKRGNGKGLTLFFVHAHGFPKETWEPTLKHLLASSSDLVDEIWTWEAIQHGDAALVNSESLSSLYDWIDNTRDILNFFIYFIPSSPSSSALPVHLPRVPDSESKQRAVHGLQERNIATVGHSFGGCACALASLNSPNLFSSLILIEPMIIYPYELQKASAYSHPLSIRALARRDTWQSKSEALSLFKQTPFFATWDPEVLDLYINCGLYFTCDAKGDQITKLKTSSLLEATVFLSGRSQQEVYAKLGTLDEKVRLRWIMAGIKNPDELGPPGAAQQRVWLRSANSSNVKIPGAGHLIVQERPRELANDLRDFLNGAYSTPLYTKL